MRHFIQCFIQIKLSFIKNEADSCHHRQRLTNLQQNCHYEETQAGHKAIFEAPNLCLKLYYTEINIWQNQRILHTDLTFTLGLAQRCTVTAEQLWGHKVIQAFVGSYLIWIKSTGHSYAHNGIWVSTQLITTLMSNGLKTQYLYQSRLNVPF